MSYAGSAGWGNAGNAYEPYQRPMGQAEADLNALRAKSAYYNSVEGDREMYERGLQQSEQQRRQYDSETARQSQDRKYGVLGGLISKMGNGPSYGGYDGFGGGGLRILSSKKIGGRPQSGQRPMGG